MISDAILLKKLRNNMKTSVRINGDPVEIRNGEVTNVIVRFSHILWIWETAGLTLTKTEGNFTLLSKT